ncbi:hypothetical protein PDIDSM_9117 [Penicillium digitatum]|nr:hypothetical protein PDIDSM_9117 [Penicillium digitatum]
MAFWFEDSNFPCIILGLPTEAIIEWTIFAFELGNPNLPDGHFFIARTTIYLVASAEQTSGADNVDAPTSSLSLMPVLNGSSKLTETRTAILMEPTTSSSKPTSVYADSTSFEVADSTSTASRAFPSGLSIDVDVSAEAAKSLSSEAVGNSGSALQTASAVIQTGASNSIHSFSALSPTAVSSSTLTFCRNERYHLFQSPGCFNGAMTETCAN